MPCSKTGKLTIFRNGRPSMIVDVAKRAEKSLSENDKTFGMVKYRPFDAERFAA